jgi:hypothetical protein
VSFTQHLFLSLLSPQHFVLRTVFSPTAAISPQLLLRHPPRRSKHGGIVAPNSTFCWLLPQLSSPSICGLSQKSSLSHADFAEFSPISPFRFRRFRRNLKLLRSGISFFHSSSTWNFFRR